MSKYICVIRPFCLWSFRSQGSFFSDSSHHVGLPLSSFTDLLCIHGYHPTLYTVEPPLRLHSLCLPQGREEDLFFWGGGGAGAISDFWKGTRGFTKIFDRRKGGLLIFSPLTKKGIIFFLIFFIKEDHPNYSMLEESLLAYLLYKYSLYRTFIINIKVKSF